MHSGCLDPSHTYWCCALDANLENSTIYSVRDCAWAFFSLQKERWHPYPHLPHHGDIRFVSKGTRSWQRNAPQSKSYFPEPSRISSRFSDMHISERWSIFSFLMEQAGMSSRVAMARQWQLTGWMRRRSIILFLFKTNRKEKLQRWGASSVSFVTRVCVRNHRQRSTLRQFV